jgi:hypothetical protein
MEELNNGRFGYSVPIIWGPGEPLPEVRMLIFQPCERISACPWGAVCSKTNFTSAWICTLDSTGRNPQHCDPFGTVSETRDPKLVDDKSLDKGFYYEFDKDPVTGTSAKLQVECDRTYTPGHL